MNIQCILFKFNNELHFAPYVALTEPKNKWMINEWKVRQTLLYLQLDIITLYLKLDIITLPVFLHLHLLVNRTWGMDVEVDFL